MGKFVITKKPCGKYQVMLKSKAGNILLLSSEYAAKISCKKAIELLRIYSQDAAKYQKKTTVDWELYFYLKSKNGQAIGISPKYQSTFSREQVIERIKRIAPIADVEDLS
ncbi:DUF1508 domain-containing protein [Flavobacterium pectinovorum]|uniref:DUF1508 domain-containing protein n=1 Tax=Flavobacterium pectinovorum TaxID=29533 RepID=A0A502F7E1_9FLAO|nr:YegP family protein [Flavobacterium pectinovorum]TPG45272.1 DUF1508 domain-containing protein [Flavobacterium pectinovorum]